MDFWTSAFPLFASGIKWVCLYDLLLFDPVLSLHFSEHSRKAAGNSNSLCPSIPCFPLSDQITLQFVQTPQIQARMNCVYFTFLQGTGRFPRGKTCVQLHTSHRCLTFFFQWKPKGDSYWTTIIHYLTFFLFSEKRYITEKSQTDKPEITWNDSPSLCWLSLYNQIQRLSTKKVNSESVASKEV